MNKPLTRKRWNRRTDEQLQYQALEPRKMLAGNLNDVVFSAGFEDVTVVEGAYGHFTNVSGLLATVAPVEIQNNVPSVGPASQGNNLLELDGINGVAVELTERVDEGLVLRFDYSPRPNVRNALNEVEIWWNGELLNTVVRNGRRLRTTDFQSYEFGLPAVASGSATLEFRSNATRDRKGLGGLIDNVSVLASSAFPGLNDIADQELSIGDSLSVTAELEEPVEDEVTFSILNGPEGLEIDPSTGELTWVATQSTVNNSNAANRFRQTGTQEQIFQSGFEQADVPDGQYQFFESIDGFETSNAGVGVEIQNNHFTVGPASEGENHLELDGTNGIFRNVDTSDAADWQIQLDFSPRPGVAASLNEVELWWDGERVETLNADGTRLAGTAFTRHAFNLPQPSSASTRLELRSNSPEDAVGTGGLIDNVVLNRTGVTQALGQQDKFQVVVQASNDSQFSTTEFLICINESAENSAPTLAAVALQQVDEETELTLQLSASDPDSGDTIAYEIVTGPDGVTIDSSTGLLRWTPTESDGPGQAAITARVSDGNGGSDQQTIQIQVDEVNRDPVLEPIANRTVDFGGDVSFTVTATDPDLPVNALSFALSGDVPTGAAIDAASGQFSWPSTAAVAGVYPLTVTVADGQGGTASQEFTVDVGVCPFHDSLEGWAAAENGGSAGSHGTVTAEDCVATIAEGDSFETTLSTTFVVPNDATQLSFAYEDLNFDTSDPSFINDAFEVALVDSAGRSLVDTYADDRDAFFNITESLPAVYGDGVTMSDTVVTLDVSTILAGEVATLIFRLANNDSDTATSVQITDFSIPGFGSGPTAGTAKFYVADPEIDSVFSYDANGLSQNSFLSSADNQQSHGLTSNADGSRLWAVDNDTGQVSVYGGNGVRIGTWTPQGVTGAEGIATDGTHFWILSGSEDRVYFFGEVAERTEGTISPIRSFTLDAANASPSGVTSDGDRLWIVDDAANVVFVYDVADGALLGSWQLDAANSDPSGITNDANGGSSLWVVDRSGTVFHYANSIAALSGSLVATNTFLLDDRNGSPEGIADPVTVSASSPSSVVSAGDTVLISGVGQYTIPSDSPENPIGTTLVSVTVNDTPVEVLDLTGRFFTRRKIELGSNSFEIEALDSDGQLTTSTLVIEGRPTSTVLGFNNFVDVTGGFSGVYGRTSFDQRDERLYVDLATRNDGTFATDVPLYLGVKNISDPSVELLDADGITPAGVPFYDFSSFVDDGRLDPAELTGSPTIAFANPSRVQFDYDLKFYTRLNKAPEITSLPDIEALAGRLYEYEVEAIDRDNDPLTYQLLVHPEGMNIDSQTGVISWEPTATDIGNYDIAVEVSDGRGGRAEQRFTLSVIELPPNRPPVITSEPVTVANLSDTERENVGRLVVGHDVNTLSRSRATGNEVLFALNVANWLTEKSGNRILLLESNATDGTRDYAAAVESALEDNGFVITVTADYDLSEDFLFSFDAVFLGEGSPSRFVDNSLLTRFINGGGGVYLFGGVAGNGGAGSVGEAAGWRPFLNDFGLDFAETYNSLFAVTDVSDHPIWQRISTLRSGNGQSIIDLDPNDSLGQIVVGEPELGFYAVFDGHIQLNESTYNYQVDAFDPDFDPLTYQLVDSPSGLVINAETGLINWNPTADQIGNHDVTVRVEDGRGGVAEQSFVVGVKGDPENNAPVIVSTPITDFTLAGASNPAIGEVSPTSISVDEQSALVEQTVTFTLPEDGGQIGTADVIFVVDESRSMAGEQAGLGNIIETLDQSLQTSGLANNRYGLVGFANSGRILQSGDDIWMDATTFAETTGSLSTGRSGNEDGYLGIDFALDNYQFRENVSRVVVLVTDEERTTVDGSLSFESTQQRLEEEEILFSIVANAGLEDSAMSPVFGVAQDGTSYSSAANGEVAVSNGGIFTGPEFVSRGTIANIGPEYVDLAWAVDGVVWDLNFLRQDEQAADTFTEVFVDVLGENIVRNIPITVLASIPDVGFVNRTGVQTDIAPGAIVTFDIEFTTSSATQFDVTFVNANTNEILGSIPVSVGNEYKYHIVAIDPDDDEVDFNLTEGPDDIMLDTDTGLLTWSPPVNAEGVFPVSARVSDSRGGFDEQRFDIGVVGAGSGTIRGQLFDDIDSSGSDENEPSIAGWVIYLDQNQNGVRDIGERFTTTDAEGNYEFDNLPEGTYFVREELQSGWRQTLPGDNSATQPLGDGFADTVVEFFDSGAGPIAGPYGIANTQAPVPLSTDVVLGAPPSEPRVSGNAELDAISLPTGSFVTVGFTDETIVDGPGPDIFIRSLDPADAASEFADIYISSDLVNFVKLGTVQEDAPGRVGLDLADIGFIDPVRGVRVVGLDNRGASPGFELVSVEVLPGSIGFGDGGYTIPLSDAQTVDNIDFGNVELAEASNLQPIIQSSGPGSATIGELYRYEVEASDPENSTLRFELLTAPAGMTVHPTLGVLVWTPDENQRGNNDVLLRVSDADGAIAFQRFAVRVTNPNVAPRFVSTPNLTAIRNQTYSYRISTLDADGDSLNIELSQVPDGVTVELVQNSNDQGDIVEQFFQLQWDVPTDAPDSAEFAIEAVDGNGGLTQQTWTVNIADTGQVNVAPIIDSSPSTMVRFGIPWQYEIAASDRNGDELTYSLLESPNGMTIGDSGMVTWSAPSAGLSPAVTVAVSDGESQTTQEFTLNVVSLADNQTPQIVSIPHTRALENELYTFTAEAVDLDGDQLRWSLEQAPRGMAIDSATGQIFWTPDNLQLGGHVVAIVVTDTFGASASQRFELEVNCINHPPVILSVPPTTGLAGRRYIYAVRANDFEGDTLTWSLADAAPDGARIDSATGLIRWQPTNAQIGSHNIAIEVTDGINTTTQSYTVVISASDDLIDPNDPESGSKGNRAPLITSDPVFNAEVDLLYSYQVAATDLDGDTVTFAIAGDVPAAMSINDDGLITWTPTVSDVGEYLISVVASDDEGATSSQGFLLSVVQNSPPEILSTAPTSAVRGSTYRYSVRAVDPESGTLNFELTDAPDGMTIDRFGRIIWDVETDQTDPIDVSVTVTDDRRQTDTESWQIAIFADTQAPNLNLGIIIEGLRYQESAQVDLNSVYIVSVIATDNVRVESVLLEVDGQQVPLNERSQITLTAQQLGNVSLRAVATDASGNATEATGTVQITDPATTNTSGTPGPGQTVPTDPTLPPHPGFDPSDNQSPVIEITSPEQLSAISNTVSIIGTVDDPEDNLWYYRVLAAKADEVSLTNLNVNDPDWQLINESTTEVIDGELAVFDPSAVENGAYVIAVAAFDVNGKGFIQPTVLYVEGNVLLGNFTLSFTDLSIPLAGIPIEITRVYDTVNADEEGDFGFGWTLGAQDARILEVAAIAPGGSFNPGNNNFAPDQTKVYLTNPAGQRVGFTYKEELISASFFGGVWRPYFEADPGVYDILAIDETRVARGGIIGSLAQGINPSFYTLTTKDQLSYRYADSGTLLSIKDLNGNEATFTSEGVQHSSGQSIDFVRDHRGRIISIVDPAGNAIRYEYDLAGDLVKFSNQEEMDVEYRYQSNPAHYLDEAYDSLGRRTIKVEYDEENMFVGVLDADGNRLDDRDYDTDSNRAVVRDANGNETTLLYDDRGNVIEETDAAGNVIFREYNDPANPDLETRIVDRRGNVTEREYDSRGNLLKLMELGGPENPLASPTETNFIFDSGNRVSSIINSDNQVTTFRYDTQGNLTRIVNAAGDSAQFVYDNQGRRTSFTDFNGNVTTFEYADGDQPAKVTFADGSYQQFEYNQFGQVTFEGQYEADETLVETSRTTYDKTGRSIEEITGEGDSQTIVRRVYDGQLLDWEAIVDPQSLNANGNLTESPSTPIENRNSRITDFEYDSRDRLIVQTDAEGGVVHFRYDMQGNRVALMDPVGNVTTWIYDELNRVIEERDPLYWEDLKTRDAAFSGLTDLEFLDLIAPVTEGDVADPLFDDPSGADTTTNTGADHVSLTAYDAEGNIAKEIDRNGRRLEFDYDFAGRLLEENWYASGTGDLVNTVQFTYDLLGNQLTAVDLKIGADDTESRYTFTYDSLNRLVSSDNAGTPGVSNVVLTYDYDAQGNVVSTADNFGVTVASEYDSRNRLSVRTWFDADGSGDVDDARVEFDYNAAGRTTEMRRYAGRIGDAANLIGKTVRTFDLAGRSDELNHLDSADANISSYNYNYDFAGLLTGESRIHQLSQFSQEIVYAYDLTGQLLEANHTGQADENYRYDANGNRESSIAHGTNYSTESGNRLASDGQFSYEYDGEGNLVLKTHLVTDDEGQAGETTSYEYDHRNRLVKVTIKPSADSPIVLDEVSYQYDALGRRIARTENGDTIHFVYNGDNVWADFNEAGEAVARYLFGNSIDQNLARFRPGEGTVWYLTDRLGTIRDLVDASGVLVNHTQLDSYGQILSQLNEQFTDRFAFTGREFDALTRDYYYRARFFNPSVGRFVSNDPLGFDAGDLNLYRYVSSSPLNGTDPTGEFFSNRSRLLIGVAACLSFCYFREWIWKPPQKQSFGILQSNYWLV